MIRLSGNQLRRGGHHVCERDFGKEVRCQAERRGTRTAGDAASQGKKHGNWFDPAESELGVLSCQCLDRRIPDKQTLIDEIAAWELNRNAHHATANWHFTTPNARIKLKHLYPAI